MGNGIEYVEIQGRRIAFQRAGNGPPLVLLHGILGDSRMWQPQIEALSREFTVIAWDTPGCGQSSDPPDTFRLPEYAVCLGDFIDHLGYEQTYLLGLSWGGGLAIELYRQKPSSVKAMILAATYAGWAGSLSPEVVTQRLQSCLRESYLAPQEFIHGWIPGLLTDSAPPEMISEVVSLMSEFHPAGYRVMAQAFAEADLRDVLPSIGAPTLLIYGDEDKRSPLPVGQALHDRIPASQLVVLPGVGHLSNVEAPDQFNDQVRNFLKALN